MICIDGLSNPFSCCVYVFHGVFFEPNILIAYQETCPPPSVPHPCVWHPNVSMIVAIASILSGQSTYDLSTLNDVNSYATCRSLRILWHVQKQVGSRFCNRF